MISKDNFDDIIRNLGKIKKVKKQLLNNHIYITGLINPYEEVIYNLLTECLDKESANLINWWLYDREKDTSFIKNEDGVKIDLSTKNKLFNFLFKNET